MRRAALALLLVATSLSCSRARRETLQALDIPFAALLNGRELSCSEAGEVLLNDLRFFVHDLRLIDVAGHETAVRFEADGTWQTEELALLDFEDGTGHCDEGTSGMNRSVRVLAPIADWQGLRFRVGVPFALNHASPTEAVAPLTLGQLHWGWQSGYKFMRLDADVNGEPFRLHLGSTGCEGEMGDIAGCARGNRPEIDLDGAALAQSRVILDVDRLLAGVSKTEDPDGKPGCMSGFDDPECRVPFEALGLDQATGRLNGGQLAFRLAAAR